MRPDPRADYILRWRYAAVAERLRASARDAEDTNKADTLFEIADHYERLAATPQSEHPTHLRLVVDRADEVLCDRSRAPRRRATREEERGSEN